MFWRSPISAFFTIILPLFMMSLFSSIFTGDLSFTENGVETTFSYAEFFVPALASFSLASATYTNLAVSMSIYREERILKRVRSTPLPAWIYIVSAFISAAWVGFLSCALMLAVGIIAFDVGVLFGQLVWMAAFFLAGVATFSILGLVVAGAASSGRAAPAIANATILPLAFISDIFIYFDSSDSPAWIEITGDIFPLKRFAEGFRLPFVSGGGVSAGINLIVICAWGAAAFVFVLKYFSWLPKAESQRGSSKLPKLPAAGKTEEKSILAG